jgi:ATPase family associated with various cellular activities (AAA)
MKKSKKANVPLVENELKRHFRKLPLQDLVTAGRGFPPTARVDLQLALDKMFSELANARLIGVHSHFGQHMHMPLTIAHLLGSQHFPVVVGPLQHDEIDIGETLPARCLRQGLWLARQGTVPFALLLSFGTYIEIAVPPGEAAAQLSRRFLDELEEFVRRTGSYRGKVISLDHSDGYSGKHTPVYVHKLHNVQRDEVILPEKTMRLLDRNIGDFVRQREKLRKLGLPIKKGLLFYGAPGTGKTHTVHYLAGQLPDHTTLLVTAEQVANLDHYFQLARFLQPAMIVIEDVDLIARDRGSMYGPGDESLLNKLLNEMDGLREDAAILFILTTNRPQNLEAALASRPGRIDQAIEFPLPDENGRRLLVGLYACGLPLDEDVVETIVSKTDKASAAFIKELMRRAAQFYMQNGSGGALQVADVNAALEEMLFTGGTLNAKLLGAADVAFTPAN